MEDSITLSALGIVATLAAAMIWLLKVLFKQNDGTLKEVARNNALLADSIKKLAVTGDKQTEAIERQEIATEKWQKYVTKRFDELKITTDETLNIIKKEGS